MEILIGKYSIGEKHALEPKSLEDVKKDDRFFHLEKGEYRDQLCKELWEAVKERKKEKQETNLDKPKGSTNTK